MNWIITDWFRTEAYYASGGWRATWKGEGGGGAAAGLGTRAFFRFGTANISFATTAVGFTSTGFGGANAAFKASGAAFPFLNVFPRPSGPGIF